MMLVGCLALLIACPIVFVVTLSLGYVVIGGGERTDFVPDRSLPGWLELIPYAVAGIATLGLVALIVGSFARGLPSQTLRRSS